MLLNFHKSSYSSSGDNCVQVAHATPSFRTSTYSTGGDNCVEVADLPTGAAVRDSKHPELGFLPFAAPEWASFAHALRRGSL